MIIILDYDDSNINNNSKDAIPLMITMMINKQIDKPKVL